MRTFEESLKESLQDDEFKKEYELLEKERDQIRKLIQKELSTLNVSNDNNTILNDSL